MEDEIAIFVRKQLSSAQPAHRRVGIIGTVALVHRLGTAAGVEGMDEASAVGEAPAAAAVAATAAAAA
jgi:hypothetical protein